MFVGNQHDLKKNNKKIKGKKKRSVGERERQIERGEKWQKVQLGEVRLLFLPFNRETPLVESRGNADRWPRWRVSNWKYTANRWQTTRREERAAVRCVCCWEKDFASPKILLYYSIPRALVYQKWSYWEVCLLICNCWTWKDVQGREGNGNPRDDFRLQVGNDVHQGEIFRQGKGRQSQPNLRFGVFFLILKSNFGNTGLVCCCFNYLSLLKHLFEVDVTIIILSLTLLLLVKIWVTLWQGKVDRLKMSWHFNREDLQNVTRSRSQSQAVSTLGK